MNPALVVEISKYVDFDVPSILKDKTVEKPCNARSTSGRIGTDWLYLERCAKEKGFSLPKLSILLGKSQGYLYACKREGGISEDILIELGKILGVDYHTLIKVTSYDRWPLRYEVMGMVNNHEWTEPSKKTKTKEETQKIPRYKRVPINWNKLRECIYEQGYTYNSLARTMGISQSQFVHAGEDGKMNPFIVFEIRKYVDFDITSVMSEPTIKRIRNGRSTTGRIGTDWLYLEREAKRKGYSLNKLSVELGRSVGYLGSCKREGGLSEDIMTQIGEILNIDFHNLIKVTSYEKWALRHEVVDMVKNQEYPDFTNDMSISDLYQGTSPHWQKLKEVMTGEVSNYVLRDSDDIKESDYNLAEKHNPNLQKFSMYDVSQCNSIDDLPTDWRYLAFACMKKYGLPPFSK